MSRRFLMGSITLVVMLVGSFYLYRLYRPSAARLVTFRTWMADPGGNPAWGLAAGSRCGSTRTA